MAIDEILYLTKLGEILKVHQELNEVEPAMLDIALSFHRKAFLRVIDKLAEESEFLDNHKAFFSLEHFLIADD